MGTPATVTSPRVVLRPLGSPLPLGLAGLTIASLVVSGLDLRWVPPAQSHTLALVLLGGAVPLQLIACLFSFPGRDGPAAASLGILAGSWAAMAAVRLASAPGSTSKPLGLLLLAAGALLLGAALAQLAVGKGLVGVIIAVAAARAAASGLYELRGAHGWQTTSGWLGIAVVALAVYAVWALAIEDARHGDVLPTLRAGRAQPPPAGDAAAPLDGVVREPGVRQQL